MSKYTTEVRFICENYAGLVDSTGYNNVEEVIRKSREKVFDFNYPLYDDNYKSVLETKILKHYYTREIGSETAGLWKLWLNTRLNEIMPYYNKLYESAMIEFNPLYDTDIKTERKVKGLGHKNDIGENKRLDAHKNVEEQRGTTETERNLNSVTDGSTTNGSDDWTLFSDTPQGGLTGVKNLNYLTTATNNTTDGNTTNEQETTDTGTVTDTYNRDITNTYNGEQTDNNKLNSTFDNTEEYIEHVFGKRGGQSYSSVIKEYRETLINIDVMIIRELADLFFNLW